MRTAHSLIVSPYLIISHACPPRSNHACPPRATTHAPEQPHTPPSNHACPPEQPCMPPLEQPHMPPQEQPCTPPPEQPRTPPPPVNRMTNRSKNITLPQTSFADGKKDGCHLIFIYRRKGAISCNTRSISNDNHTKSQCSKGKKPVMKAVFINTANHFVHVCVQKHECSFSFKLVGGKDLV